MNIPQKVLIYRLGSLGDTVIVLPCFHQIRNAFPNAHITLLTNKPVASKAAPLEAVLGNSDSFFFDEIINYPVGTRNPLLLLSIIRKIRETGTRTLVNIAAARSPKSTLRDRLFFRLAGIKNFIGFPVQQDDFTVGIDIYTGQYEWEAKRLARRISQLGAIDLDNDNYWNLHLTAKEQNNALLLLQGTDIQAPIIAVSLGTKAQSNDWEISNWKKMLHTLGKLYPYYTLLLVGAPDEFAIAQDCLKAWGNKGINICGKTSPRESAVLLAKASVFIGHDSGPMHLAACMGTPCVGIFSARNPPGQWFPRGGIKNNIIYHNVDCAQCGLLVCIEQKKKCILSITIDEVIAAVSQILH